MVRKTLWESHVDRWSKGCGNDICGRAQNVVLARGEIPCDLLFLGEAPGESEDSFGSPFVGPAGYMLDCMIERALEEIPNSADLRVAFTNLVGCIPKDETYEKVGEPSHECVMGCKERLQEFLTIAKPRLVFAVGRQPEKYLEGGLRDSIKLEKGTHVKAIVHPSFILRDIPMRQAITKKHNVILIREAVENLLAGNEPEKIPF